MSSRVKAEPHAEIPAFLGSSSTPSCGREAPSQMKEPGNDQESTTALLKAHDVTKKFGDFTAVDTVSIELHHARLQALIGPNGAGKTTLFNILSGLYPPES